MKNTITTLLGSALLATGIASAHISPADAATMTCSPTVAGKVSNTTDCEYSATESQDYLNTNSMTPMTVNAEEFFGFSDWKFSTKTELTDRTGQTGTWDISSVFKSTWEDVMLVFKSARDNTKITGYMVADNALSGTWNSPFAGPNGNWRDVSHISVYYRDGGTQPPVNSVPEPATLLGLGVVASGMVMARRRKAGQSA